MKKILTISFGGVTRSVGTFYDAEEATTFQRQCEGVFGKHLGEMSTAPTYTITNLTPIVMDPASLVAEMIARATGNRVDI